MKKRVLHLLPILLAVLLVAGIPAARAAETNTAGTDAAAVDAAAETSGIAGEGHSDGEFQYRLRLGPEGFTFAAEITGYEGGRETFLKTPEKLDVFPVTAIGAGAFKGNKTLVTVSIQEGVTEIRHEAFAQCRELRTVYLPEGLESIGSLAFSGCSNLERVVIPDSVQDFGQFVFSQNSGVTVHAGRGSAAERYCQENGIKYTYLSVEEESDREVQKTLFDGLLYVVMVGPVILAAVLIRNNNLKIGVMSTSLGLAFLMIVILILQDGMKSGDEVALLLFLLLFPVAIWWGLRCFKEGIRERAADPWMQPYR